MRASTRTLALDVAIGVLAGLAATKVTEWAQTALYRATPTQVQAQEERVRPGPPAEMAAEDLAGRFGVSLDDKARGRAGNVIHYALGAAWGPLYGLLRRHRRMTAPGAGLLSGAAMSLLVDETLTPALGYSAPNRDYPALTHVRGFVGHLAFGAANAVMAEALYRLIDRCVDLNVPMFHRNRSADALAARDGFQPSAFRSGSR